MPGKHNISNALASIAVSLELNIPFPTIQKALDNFDGVNRRFTIRAVGHLCKEDAPITIIDDYAHHPTEIEATLEAARSCWPDQNITAVFQPHRYSRLQDLYNDFCQSFNNANKVIVCPVYRAGERPIEGLTEENIAHSIKTFGHRNVHFAHSLDEARQQIQETWQAGDIVITLGAGNVNQICHDLKESLL